MAKMEDIKVRVQNAPNAPLKHSNKKSKKTAVLAAIALFFLASTAGAYTLFQKYDFQEISSAALVLFEKLKKVQTRNTEAEPNSEKAKKLLAAEENFLMAEEAAGKEDWIKARALLENSEAITDANFKFYNEAVALYEKAKNLVDSFEKEVSGQISGLQQTIIREEARRRGAESQLQETASQKQQAEQALKSTQETLKNSQSQLEEERKKAEELSRKIEKEQFQKFANEINIYLDMLKRGNEYINLALSEIEKNSDVTSLIYLSQAKVLFDGAYEKANVLKTKGTPTGFSSAVDKLIESASAFNNADKNLKNAIIYMDSKGEDFNAYFNQGKNLKSQAYDLMNSVKEAINSVI